MGVLPGMGSLAARAPAWLRTALSLSEPDVPNVLLTDGVRATVDAWQGGHAMGMTGMKYLLTSQIDAQPQNPALTLIALDSNTQALVYGFHVNNYGSAGAAAAIQVYLLQNATAGSGNVGQATVPLKASSTVQGTMGMKDFFGSAAPLWMPPGHSFVLWTPATVLNQRLDIKVLWMELPAGFKPF